MIQGDRWLTPLGTPRRPARESAMLDPRAQQGGLQEPPTLPRGRRALLGLLRTDAWVAGGVGSLGWWVGDALGHPASPYALSTLLCGTLVVYNLDHWRDERADRAPVPSRPHLNRSLRLALLSLGALGLAWGFVAEPELLLRALPAGAAGLLYGARTPGGARLKDIPGAKAWIVAGAVTQACLFVPLGSLALSGQGAAVGASLLALTALNAHCFDLRDVHLDEEAGTPSWVSRRGGGRSHRLLAVGAALAASVFAGAAAWGWVPMAAPISLALAGLSLLWVRPGASPERFGLFVDGWLWLPATATLLASVLRA